MEMTLGERIRKARKGNMTQAELAKLIGVHEITVRRWELGERTPNIKDLQRISEVLKVPMDELLGTEHKELNKDSINLSNGVDKVIYTFKDGEKLEFPSTDIGYAFFEKIFQQKMLQLQNV